MMVAVPDYATELHLSGLGQDLTEYYPSQQAPSWWQNLLTGGVNIVGRVLTPPGYIETREGMIARTRPGEQLPTTETRVIGQANVGGAIIIGGAVLLVAVLAMSRR